jgi:hypothetical protein
MSFRDAKQNPDAYHWLEYTIYDLGHLKIFQVVHNPVSPYSTYLCT